MDRNRRKGQSILEYTLLLGVIIAAIVTILLGGNFSLQNKLQGTYNKANDTIGNVANKLNEGVFAP